MNRTDFFAANQKDAYNYVISMRNALEFVRTDYHLFCYLLQQRQKNLDEITHGNKGIDEEDNHTFPPGDSIVVGDEKYSIRLLMEMSIQSLFQNAHNYFDYNAQCINRVFLNGRLSESKVNFHKVLKVLDQQSSIAQWMQSVESDSKYKLICDYNNVTKHYHMLDLGVWLMTADCSIKIKSSSFSKQTRDGTHSYSGEEITSLVEGIYSFLTDCFNEFDSLTARKLQEG